MNEQTPLLLPAPDQKTKQQGRPKGSKESRNARAQRKRRKALGLLVRGVDTTTISEATGVSKTKLKQYRKELEAIFPELPTVEQFRLNRVDIMDAAMAGLLKTMSDQEKLSKTSINNAAYAAKQLHEMGRLERGLSTVNVATFVKVDLPKK